MIAFMEDQSSRTEAEGIDQKLPSLLFVPGIEHEHGDLEKLIEELAGIARIVTVQKEDVGFSMKRKNEWETMLREALRTVADKEKIVGIIGHSFGCFRTLRLLESGLRAEFAVLLNPPQNTIDRTSLHPHAYPSYTGTHTEQRLHPLVTDLLDEECRKFMERHGKYEVKGDGWIRPWHKAEFTSLRDDVPFLELLNQASPEIPMDIIHSSTDPWDLQNWNQLRMNIRRHEIKNGGHYLATSHPQEVGTIIRSLIQELIITTKTDTSKPEYLAV